MSPREKPETEEDTEKSDFQRRMMYEDGDLILEDSHNEEEEKKPEPRREDKD